MTTIIIPLCLAWPLVLALAVLGWPNVGVRALLPSAPVPLMVAVLLGVPQFDAAWLLPGARLGVDEISTVLIPAMAVLWLAAGLAAQQYLPADRRRDHFFVWFLLAMTGNLVLLCALDAVLFYLGFAMMSFASYGLVVHSGSERARHAGRYYIVLVILGEISILSGLLMLGSRGEIEFASMRAAMLDGNQSGTRLIMALLIIGFGIKAGLIGLHFWLPLAHPVAPAPASAVLSGAMIKAGVVAWMRLFPLGESAMPDWGLLLVVAGILTAVYGVLVGLCQRESKTVLAYSSVSQMGLISMAVGLGLMFSQAWPALLAAILIYIVHHGLIKGSLFLGAGLVSHALKPVTAHLAAIVLAVGALAMAAGPLTGGLVAKSALAQAVGEGDAPWQSWIPNLLLASSVLTALLMLRFLYIAWPKANADASRTPWALLIPWLILAGLGLAWPWWLAEPELRQYVLAMGSQWNALWPMLLAVAIAAGARVLQKRDMLPDMPGWPAGDLGIALEKGVIRLGGWINDFCRQTLPHLRDGLPSILLAMLAPTNPWPDRLKMIEAHLQLWTVTATLLIFLGVLVAWLLIGG
jgi:formate hydrogenlyase subunit 3/multisubunit Na+/H+ antiporter MnhD subunit